MFKKVFRFHGLGSLNFVYKTGATVRGPLFAIKYTLNKKRTSPRFSVVVSKKVHKSAVVRNRIRRRVYAQLRKLEPAITQPYDVVVTIFSDKVASVGALELQKSITVLVDKAKLR